MTVAVSLSCAYCGHPLAMPFAPIALGPSDKRVRLGPFRCDACDSRTLVQLDVLRGGVGKRQRARREAAEADLASVRRAYEARFVAWVAEAKLDPRCICAANADGSGWWAPVMQHRPACPVARGS